MAIDFADLAIRTDYSSVDKAAASLDKLTVSSKRSEDAARSVGGAWAQVGQRIQSATGPALTDADYFAGKLAQSHTKAATAAEGHAFATGKVSRVLEGMILRATGASHELGILSVALSDFAYGSAVVTGVLAALAAIALAFELITKNARESQKAQDEAIKFLGERFRPETGRGSAVNDAYDQAIKRQALDVQKLRILRQATNDFDAAAGLRAAGFQAPLHNRQDEIDRLTQDLAKANHAIALAQMHGAGELPSVSVTSDIHQRTAEAERSRLAAERERGAEIAISVDAENRHRDEINAARRLNLVPQSALAQIPGVGQLSAAEQKHMAIVIRLSERYEEARSKFASMGNALDDFKMGLKEGITGILEQFAPSNIGKGLLDGVYTTITNAIGKVFHSISDGIRHAVFGQSGEERDAERQAAASARAMALQIDAVTKALGGDQLGATINALQIGLISTLQAINDALPGTKNEAERNRLRAEAAAQEQQQEAKAREQDALNHRYAQEDLAVRNLRALGQGDAADRLAFREQQQREMQKAVDEGRDATYLNTLATVQNNEWLAYLNGTLEQTALNMVTGYKLQAQYFAASDPHSPFAKSALSGLSALTSQSDGRGLTPPSASGDLTVNVTMADGTVIGKTVLKDFKRTAQRQFGDSTKWSAIQ